MHSAHVEYYVQLKNSLEAAPQGARGALVTRAAVFLDCSAQKIYRGLQEVGWLSRRKTRSDCGKRCIDRDLAVTVGGILKHTTRANGKRTLPLCDLTQILEDNGMGPLVDNETGEVSMPHPATVGRALKAYACHPDQVVQGQTTRQMRSLCPNHVWQMDASVCILFYLPKGEVAVLNEKKYNEKKPSHLEKLNKERVVRWVITDHYSGAIYAEYTLGTEDAATAISVLINAMCARAGSDMMHGAPGILYTDKGSAYVSTLMKTFLTRLKVRPLQHEAEKAWATGQVENAHNIVETHFEGRLRLNPVGTLEALNRNLLLWRNTWNAERIHTRHKRTRNQLWLTITKDQLRVPAGVEALRAMVCAPPELVKVPKNLVLRHTPKGYSPQKYPLYGIAGVLPGGYVGVAVNPFEAPAADVFVKVDGVETIYTVQPIIHNEAGFDVEAPVFGEEFKATPDTATDRAVKDMDKEAYGADTLEDVKKAARHKGRKLYAGINIMADIEKTKERTYLPRRGTSLDLARGARHLPPLTHMQAVKALRPQLEDLGLTWNRACMAWIEEHYPETIPADAIDDVAVALAALLRPENSVPPPLQADERPALRLAVGGV